MKTKSLLKMEASASVLVLLSGALHAQDAPSGPTAASAVVDEVVVTARRREESLLEVPLAVTAISGAKLAELNIANAWDLKTKVPGLAVQDSAYGSTQPFFGIRGQIQKSNFGSYNQSVGVYVNDIVASRVAGLNAGLYDMASVQVLKGPQGTLFGRNTPGGAILFSTVLPGDTSEGYVQATVGDYDLHRAEGAVTVPMSDKFSVRFAGRYSERDGYLRNINTGHRVRSEDEYGARVSAVYKPTDKIVSTSVVDYVDANPYPSGLRLFYVYPNAAGASRQAFLDRLNSNDFHTVDVDAAKADIETLQVSNSTSYELSKALTLKNIFGYRSVDSTNFADFDGVPTIVFQGTDLQDMDQFSDEFQVLGSADDDNLTWVAGAFWFKESGGAEVRLSLSPALSTIDHMDIVNKSVAAYAQTTWKLPFYRPLSLTLGGRYTWDDREATWRSISNTAAGTCALFAANTGTARLSPCVAQADASFSKPTYTLALDWKPLDGLLLYATTRRGYRAGGFDLQVSRPATRQAFDSEEVTDYEGGIKYEFRAMDTTGRIGVAVYRTDYDDMQRAVPTIVTEGGVTQFITRTTNAASAVIEGYEVEAVWYPIRSLELSALVNNVRPRYKSFVTATGVNLGVNAFSSTPEDVVGAGVQWTLPTPSELGDISLRLDYFYQSVSYTQDNNTNLVTGQRLVSQTIPSYHNVNLRADWSNFLSRPLDLSVFVRNLTHEEYFIAGTDLTAALGSSAMVPGEPRSFGVGLKYRF